MKTVRCPNCSYTGIVGNDCPKCGIVFAKFRLRDPVPAGASYFAVPEVSQDQEQPVLSTLRVIFRFARWGGLAVSAMFLYLILSPASPPLVDIDPTAEASTHDKWVGAEKELRKNHKATLRFTEGEVNGWLKSSTFGDIDAVAESGTEFNAATLDPATAVSGDLTLPEVRSKVTDMRVDFVADRVRAYLQFELYGKRMSFELEGFLSSRNGYLVLDPVSGRLGSFPLPSASLGTAVRRVFDSVENREKFRLPERVEDVRVNEGELEILVKRKSS